MTKLFLSMMLLLLSASQWNTQEEYMTITGTLLDAKSKTPLPYASIYLKGTSIGTTSNTEGAFIFHVPVTYKTNLVVISMIGYTAIEKQFSDFTKDEVIYLKESALALEGVVVTSEKRLTAKQIVKQAYKSISNNYPATPYVLEGFVRDLQKEDNSCVELVECAIKMHYQSNAVKKEPKIELVELRQSYIATKHPWNEQWERKNSIIDLVEDDFIRFDYGPIKGGKGWKYELVAVLPFGEKLVYHIKASHGAFYSAQFFIEVDSFAFIRIEYSRAKQNGKYYKRRLSNGQQEAQYNSVFEYQEYNGKWYLKYQKEEDVWDIFEGMEGNNMLFTKYPKKELFINKIVTASLDQYPFVNNLDRTKSIESQAKPYNPVFWKSYNALVKTKELSKIEEELKNIQLKRKE